MIGASVFAVIALAAASAQSSGAAQKPSTVTVDGCVAVNPSARNSFTLDDDGQMFLLKGLSVKDYVGKHVEVMGVTSKRLRIVGGLYPSPNIAAQNNDPTKAAMAAHSGPTSQSGRPMIEFEVKSVRVLPGSCPAAAR